MYAKLKTLLHVIGPLNSIENSMLPVVPSYINTWLRLAIYAYFWHYLEYL